MSVCLSIIASIPPPSNVKTLIFFQNFQTGLLLQVQIAILHPICFLNSISETELEFKRILNSLLKGTTPVRILTSVLCSMQMQQQYGCSMSGNVFILHTCIPRTSLTVEKYILYGTAPTLKV